MPPKQLKLIQQDPWLEPSAHDIQDRYNRYNSKLSELETNFESLKNFADGHNYFGINYDSKKKGWWYREWAPEAYALFLTGDFNDWKKHTHPLKKDEFGVWQIFIPEKEYKDLFAHESKIKVIVDSIRGEQYRIPAYITRAIQDEDTKNFTAQIWQPKKYNWQGDKYKIK